MQQVSGADFGHQVLTVVGGGAIHRQGNTDAEAQHVRDAAYAGGKLHVRHRAVSNAGSGIGKKTQLGIVKMKPVGIPYVRADPSAFFHIGKRTHAHL